VAARAALGLIARDRLLPAASATGYDQWRVGPLDPADATFVQQLGAAFPADAHALPVTGSRPVDIRSATAAIRIALAVSVADSHLGAVMGSADAPHAIVTSDPDDVRRLAAHLGIAANVVRL